MLVGPVHQEEVWTRSSQREPARSNIHTSTTALRQEQSFHNNRLANGRFWREAVVEVWMLDLASSRWLDLVQTSSGWTGPTSTVVPPAR